MNSCAKKTVLKNPSVSDTFLFDKVEEEVEDVAVNGKHVFIVNVNT